MRYLKSILIPTAQVCTIDNIFLILFTDAIVLQFDQKKAVRIQIKLGNSNIKLNSARDKDKDSAKEIARKLVEGQTFVGKMLVSLGLEFSIANYLFTTRTIDKDALEHFTSNNITVYGREELYPIWSDKIVQWAKSISYETYAKIQ
jgi:hypothetical protein